MDVKQRERLFDIIIYAMAIVAIVYVIVQTALGNNRELSFKIILGIWILIAVIILDFVEPFICRRFDNLSFRKMLLYGGYGLCSSMGCMSLYIFIINVRYVKEPVHYIFLGASLLLFVGRFVLKNIFDDIPDEVVDKTESQDTGVVVNIEEEDVEINTLSLDDEEEITVKMFKNRNK